MRPPKSCFRLLIGVFLSKIFFPLAYTVFLDIPTPRHSHSLFVASSTILNETLYWRDRGGGGGGRVLDSCLGVGVLQGV